MFRAFALLFFALVALGMAPARAQADTAAAATVAAMDSTAPVNVREVRFNAQEIAQLQTNPDFDYDRSLHTDMLWWDRLKRWIGQQLEKLFGTKAGHWIFGHLDWAFLLAAVVLVAIYLRKRLFHGGFSTDAARPRQVLEIGEDLPREDLDHLLAEAERKGQWPLAIRFHYLKALRLLIDEGQLRFQPDSTDRDYLRQLKDPARRSAFAELSFLFKWAWFGDAPLDEARYRSLVPVFIRFHTPAATP